MNATKFSNHLLIGVRAMMSEQKVIENKLDFLRGNYAIMTNRELAERLGWKSSTVKTYASRLSLKKPLQLRSKAIAEAISKPKQVKCQNCGKTFLVYQASKRKFCSLKCSRKGQATRYKKWTKEDESFIRKHYKEMSDDDLAKALHRTKNAVSLHIHYKMPDVKRNQKAKLFICDNCGKTFIKPPSLRKNKLHFCSRQCKMAYQGSQLIERICKNCGKKFYVKRYHLKQRSCNFCSQECFFLFNRGKRHPLWRGGSWRSRPKEYKELFNLVRKLSKNECQICNITEKQLGKKLDVHHVFPYQIVKNLPIEVFLAVCPHHHGQLETWLKKNINLKQLKEELQIWSMKYVQNVENLKNHQTMTKTHGNTNPS